MRSLEKRIARLQRAWQPETPNGILYDELCLFMAIETIWPTLPDCAEVSPGGIPQPCNENGCHSCGEAKGKDFPIVPVNRVLQ
jgi:hypothetical protein